MANIKSAKKRAKVIAKKTEINKARRSEMKTAVKGVNLACEQDDKQLASKKLRDAAKLLNKNVSKGTIHKNKAARLVSRMAKKVDSLGK